MNSFVRKNLAVIVAAVLCLGLGIAYVTVNSVKNDEVSASATTVSEKEKTFADRSVQASKEIQEVVNEVSGVQQDRIDKDNKTIEEFLGRAFTWDSHASYTQARDSVMRVHNLKADSPFMKEFMPPAPVNVDKQGNEYPYIDAAGLNQRVGAYRAKVQEVEGTEYHYVVFVDVQARSDDKKGTSSTTSVVYLTTDGTGAISDLSGYASTQKERESQN